MARMSRETPSSAERPPRSCDDRSRARGATRPRQRQRPAGSSQAADHQATARQVCRRLRRLQPDPHGRRDGAQRRARGGHRPRHAEHGVPGRVLLLAGRARIGPTALGALSRDGAARRHPDLPRTREGANHEQCRESTSARGVGGESKSRTGHRRRCGGSNHMTGRFEGRTALVTGGGRGIGAATATRFAADGAKVVISDLDLEPAEAVAAQIRSQGRQALAVACDVTDRLSVEALVDRAVKAYAGLDILVTCAGILRDNLIHKMTDTDWDLVVDTHLKGTFLCAQAAQRVMVPARRGKMVFLSSNSALGNRGQVNYSAAKAGIQGMARTLAIELGPFNINVNAVAPGFIETRMTQAVAERTGIDYEDLKRAAAERIPLKRIGQPADIAGVIGFLCSDDASFVNGQTIYATGGP